MKTRKKSETEKKRKAVPVSAKSICIVSSQDLLALTMTVKSPFILTTLKTLSDTGRRVLPLANATKRLDNEPRRCVEITI